MHYSPFKQSTGKIGVVQYDYDFSDYDIRRFFVEDSSGVRFAKQTKTEDAVVYFYDESDAVKWITEHIKPELISEDISGTDASSYLK